MVGIPQLRTVLASKGEQTPQRVLRSQNSLRKKGETPMVSSVDSSHARNHHAYIYVHVKNFHHVHDAHPVHVKNVHRVYFTHVLIRTYYLYLSIK